MCLSDIYISVFQIQVTGRSMAEKNAFAFISNQYDYQSLLQELILQMFHILTSLLALGGDGDGNKKHLAYYSTLLKQKFEVVLFFIFS